MGKTSAASKNKYNAKAYDRINLTVPKGYKDRISEAAKANGESVNGFIKRLIDAELGENSGNIEAECMIDLIDLE